MPMNIPIKKMITAAAVLVGTVLLSGCVQYGDGLLALPSLPAEHVELQSQINKVLETGAVSAAAESGANRQSIQQIDLDGDSENEYIAFFRDEDGNYLIKAYKKTEDDYEEIGSAEAVGLTLHSIYYPVSSVTGEKSLAVCWGIDESNNYGMTVYTFTEHGMENVLNVQYSGILVGDFNGDSLDELCFATKDQSGGQLSLRVYEKQADTYVLESETLLCSEARSISQMTLGKAGENHKALFLDSVAYGGGFVSDVIVYGSDGNLRNLTRDRDNGSGIGTWRSVEVFCQDIDSDGLLEVPTASSMMSALYSDEKSKLSWVNFSSDGSTVHKMRTYHVPSDDWYFLWPDQWDDRVVVQMNRYSRMVKTSFFALPDHYSIAELPAADENNTILNLYIFSGDNQQAYLATYEATEILRRDGMVYAYSLGKYSDEYAVTDEQILAAFKTIETEWTLEAYGG